MNWMKKVICNVLITCKVDNLLRYVNKNKLLVVMYHGICRNDYDPPVWTQLPEKIFREQIKFLKSSYNILSLSQVISIIQSNKQFPERSAMITFDDGLRNNYTVAFPILKQYSVPAAIFLTMDFINTNKILWVDELLFLIKEMVIQGQAFEEFNLVDNYPLKEYNIWDVYLYTLNKMKRMSEGERKRNLEILREKVRIDLDELLIDFGMLTWEQVLEMESSGIIDFANHTANHCILTNIRVKDWYKEIKEPGERLSNILGKEILSFCYPNGRPEIDFIEHHIDYLKKCGYVCAFTTEASLFDPKKDEPFRIGRIPAGNDFTSHPAYFKLSSSGIFSNIETVFDKRICLWHRKRLR